MSPALYDLTSLQRGANGRFGYSAKTTLALAQTLYERHKALTYPRTDSRYLPEDYLNTVKETMRALAQGGSNAVGGLARHAGTVVGEGWVKPTAASSTTRRCRTTLPSSPRCRSRMT